MPEWVVLILVALIAATPSTVAAIIAALNLQKAEVIHQVVNGNLTHVKAELAIANNRIAELLAILDARKPKP